MSTILDHTGKPFADTENDIFNNKGWESFTFGEPTPVTGGRELLDYTQTWNNGRYYEPQISQKGLHKTLGASPHHASGVYVKRNILTSTMREPKLGSKNKVSFKLFDKLAMDAGLLNNAFVRRKTSRTGKLLGFEYLPAMYTRKMTKGQNRYCYLNGTNDIIEYKENEVFHYSTADSAQEIYGLPEYLSCLQAAWLNESATIFRRRYYENGSHAGFILYMTDTAHQESDINNLRQSLKDAKGPGNFKNLMMYAPGGKKDGLSIIPISEVTAKDEFNSIKNWSMKDVLAAHRVPAELMGIPAENTGGYGNPETVARVFFRNELLPLQRHWNAINEWAGESVIEFDEYSIDMS